MKPPGFRVLKGIPVKQQPFRRETNKLVNKRGNVNPTGWNEQNETSRNHTLMVREIYHTGRK